MSEKIEQPDPPEQPEQPEQPERETPVPAVVDGRSHSRPRPLLASLALVLALVALGLWAWQWQHTTDDPGHHEAALAEQSALRDRIERLDSGFDGLAGRVDELATAVQDSRGDRQGLEQSLESASASIDGIKRDMATLEDELGQRMQALAEREGEQRQADREFERRMLMLEAASLLRLGQERAELAADWSSARDAYRRASALLQQADDPRLGAARRELARELDTLESIESPDWLRIQVRIERLSAQAEDWPRPPSTGQSSGDDSSSDSEAGWVDSLKGVFGQLVRVRTREGVALDDEELELLRRQIGLRLTAAELAAARRDATELAHHLRSARDLLTSNFDPAAVSVIEALRELDALAELSPAGAPSGLGRALAALREHMDRT